MCDPAVHLLIFKQHVNTDHCLLTEEMWAKEAVFADGGGGRSGGDGGVIQRALLIFFPVASLPVSKVFKDRKPPLYLMWFNNAMIQFGFCGFVLRFETQNTEQ